MTAGNTRSTSDLPQEAPATAAAAQTEGINGTAMPSSGTSTGAGKPSTTTGAAGIGSQGKPAVPAQPSKTAETGKHNGKLVLQAYATILPLQFMQFMA